MRKTNMPKGIARMAMTAGLTGAMLLGGMATSVTPALAESGTIVVNNQANAEAAYRAYQVFTADVKTDTTDPQNPQDLATSVHYVSDGVKTVVSNFIKAWDGNGDGVSDFDTFLLSKYGAADKTALNNAWTVNGVLPEDIELNQAEYISWAISDQQYAVGVPGSPTASGTTTTPRTTQGLSFANELAQALAASGVAPQSVSTASGATSATLSGDEGYWLLVTDPTSIGVDETGSAPIWTTLSNDNPKNINEKTAVPTVDKLVKDDATGAEFTTIADAEVGQDLDYKITAQLPQNMDAFEKYQLTLADTLPDHMDLANSDISSVAVSVGGQDITSHLKLDGEPYGAISYANGILTINIKDAKSNFGANYSIQPGSQVLVTYRAHLTPGATLGAQGNDNAVVMTYSSDPNFPNQTKTATVEQTKTTTYALNMTKVDKQTRQRLQGAKFACTTVVGGTTYYVKPDGSLVTITPAGTEVTEAELTAAGALHTTAADGSLLIQGVDEGDYTLTEISAPTGYDRIDAPVTINVARAFDTTTGTMTSLSGTYGGGESDVRYDGANVATTDAPAHLDGITDRANTLASGTVKFTVSDELQILFPLTGQKGRTIIAGAGIAVAAGITIALVVRAVKRRKNDEYEYEWVEE